MTTLTSLTVVKDCAFAEPRVLLFYDANRPFIVASRSGAVPPCKAAKFDYFQEEAYENPFKADANIDRLYLLSPSGSHGVGPKDDVPAGALHKHILDTGVDYAVLRPSWFNFALGFAVTIRDYGHIFSATEYGRLAFVSTEDIAQAAFDALTAEKSPNQDTFVLGPELLIYDEAAKVVSSILGREITHKHYTIDELANFFVSFGLDPVYAKFLASMEGRVAKGDEEAIFNSPHVTKFIGKHTLAEFIQDNKALYVK